MKIISKLSIVGIKDTNTLSTKILLTYIAVKSNSIVTIFRIIQDETIDKGIETKKRMMA